MDNQQSPFFQPPQPGFSQPDPKAGFSQPAPAAGASQPQYGYQPQPQPPQYGYQPQQPQYGYQPQQPQYGYQPQQPQYGYQPQQPQYGAYPGRSYGSPTPAAALGTKAVPSMVLMIISLVFLIVPIVYIFAEIADRPGRILILDEEVYAYLGIISLLAGAVLMLVGAIRGTRGTVLFGVGLFPVAVFVILIHLVWMLDASDLLEYIDGGTLMLISCILLVISFILGGIGVLTRVRGLAIAGGAVAIAALLAMCICYFDLTFDHRKDEVQVMEILGMVGTVLLSVALVCFPVRKTNN